MSYPIINIDLIAYHVIEEEKLRLFIKECLLH